jgi:hypothetical protein
MGQTILNTENMHDTLLNNEIKIHCTPCSTGQNARYWRDHLVLVGFCAQKLKKKWWAARRPRTRASSQVMRISRVRGPWEPKSLVTNGRCIPFDVTTRGPFSIGARPGTKMVLGAFKFGPDTKVASRQLYFWTKAWPVLTVGDEWAIFW